MRPTTLPTERLRGWSRTAAPISRASRLGRVSACRSLPHRAPGQRAPDAVPRACVSRAVAVVVVALIAPTERAAAVLPAAIWRRCWTLPHSRLRPSPLALRALREPRPALAALAGLPLGAMEPIP